MKFTINLTLAYAAAAAAMPATSVDLPEGVTAAMLPRNADLAKMPVMVSSSMNSKRDLLPRTGYCGDCGECANGLTCVTICSYGCSGACTIQCGIPCDDCPA